LKLTLLIINPKKVITLYIETRNNITFQLSTQVIRFYD